MNERAFSTFREIVMGLLREFEKDRAYILSQFSVAYDLDNPEAKDIEEGRKIAKQVLQEAPPDDQASPPSADKDKGSGDPPKQEPDQKLRQVSQAYNSEIKKN
ncbi:hypothetical protein, partial [Halomonas sp. ND22Bw]|uniref:hypothetical protein n=1 Tax=Halomonas sp. ND22Bw TaxID=2054178 RepID=UPI0011B24CE2